MRSHTASFHSRVDAAFGSFDLKTVDGYGGFLTAHAIALGAAERIGRTPPARRRHPLLVMDLAEMGLGPPEPASLAVDALQEPARRGVLYVLEGSRLGGAILRRHVPARFPTRFLSARHGSGEWKAFLGALDEWAEAQPEAGLTAALTGADVCFQLFEEAALRVVRESFRGEAISASRPAHRASS